ncbi:MAG: CoA transferase [Gammaproteobacteria bacterium]|nr:CoA transferase [Gammaproteobacteria bacterium]MDH5303825.1 CoA transferase [Gammaproteobacteria bacterium]MDH5322312.1 CoA transferase [Gammaproteobacteria bacterium]
MSKASTLPLDGIRIVDFTQVMMGPSATQMLADFGADVIKIENPRGGDLSRTAFGASDEVGLNNPVFCSLNRNKRSLALDLRQDENKDIVYQLIRDADVVVSNFRAGVMDRIGFGYEKLRELNPKLIFASGSGYGPTGPYAHKGGQDVLAQAMSGVMMRRADASVPMSIYPTALCDYTAGMHLVQAILVALIGVAKTGKGQCVEVSLYDSMIAMQMQEATCHLHSGKEINWAEMPLTGVFPTADGALVLVGAFKANPLQDICKVLQIEDLSVEYPDLAAQRAAKAYLQDRFRAEFSKQSTTLWIERLEAADLLCAPVKELSAVLDDEQTKANEMIVEFEHPLNGRMRAIACPIHFSAIDCGVRMAPPRLGEHNDEILGELRQSRASRASA